MATVSWSDHALGRMMEQTRYVAAQSCSVETAWKWANDIFDEANRLADFPDIGHPIPEFPDAPYREIIVRRNYRLIYRRSSDVCHIVTVRRCSMLLEEATMAELDSIDPPL